VIINVIILAFGLISGTQEEVIRRYAFIPDQILSVSSFLSPSDGLNLFELDLVKSEFELHGFRIDTLAFDEESRAFVIIEYKKDRNFSVVDQSMAYLNLMLNNKADFILEYNESSNSSHNLKREQVDWSQSRIISFHRSLQNISSML
jgi:hypothetical protein